MYCHSYNGLKQFGVKECLVDKGKAVHIYLAIDTPIKPFEIWTLLQNILSIVSTLTMYLYVTEPNALYTIKQLNLFFPRKKQEEVSWENKEARFFFLLIQLGHPCIQMFS